MKLSSYVLLIPLIFIVVLFLYTWLRFRQRIYIHTSTNLSLINKYPLPHQVVKLKTTDGVEINAWYSPVKDAKAVVILVHGFTDTNGGKGLMLPHAKYLVENGYSVFLPDLRASGDSGGNKTYLGAREWKEIEASYDYLKSLKENTHLKIGYLGISMGAVTSLIDAGETQKGDFVLASVPFAKFDDQFKFELNKVGLPPLLFFPFLKGVAQIEFGNYSQYDPAKMIIKIHVPTLIFAGKNDGDISYSQAEYLYSIAHEPKSYWLANAGHDIHAELPLEFQARVLNFLNKYSK